MYTKSTGTCPPSSMWGLPAFTVPLHHAPVPEEQGPDAHGEQAVACGESSAGSAPARDTGRPCFFSRSIIHLLCKYPRNMDKGEGESPRDPLPEMAHISLDFFFFFNLCGMSTGPLPCTFPSLQLTTLYHIRQLCKRGTPGYLSFSLTGEALVDAILLSPCQFL